MPPTTGGLLLSALGLRVSLLDFFCPLAILVSYQMLYGAAARMKEC